MDEVSFRRKGSTAKGWYGCGSAVFFAWPKDSAILLTFEMGASGGTSDVQLRIPKEQFESLAIEMIHADREAAIRAFGAALQWEPRSVRLLRERAEKMAAAGGPRDIEGDNVCAP